MRPGRERSGGRRRTAVAIFGNRLAAVLARPTLPRRWSGPVFLILLAALALVSFIDLRTGAEVSLAVLYVIPPLVGAMVVGLLPAVFLAAAAALAWAVGVPAGSARVISSSAHAVDALVRFVGVAAAVLLVDALRRTMDRAIDSDRRARDFLGMAAHQMRTPVAALRASAETLISMGGTSDQEPFLLDIAVESARIGRLLNNLLWVARLDGGAEYPVRRSDPVQACAEEVARVRRRSPLSIEVHAGPQVVVETAEHVLRESVANLLDNAVRHAVSKVDVTITVDRQSVVVMVTDDGPGLPAGAEEEVFRRFVSFDGGAGLGLSLCRDAARRMGGDLRHSDRSFVLSLPARPEPPTGRSAAPADPTSERVNEIQPS